MDDRRVNPSIDRDGPRPRSSGSADHDRGPSEPSAPSDFRLPAPVISLPKGGGAVKGIDEQFSVNPCNGTASLSLPLPFSPAREGFVPPVRIAYDSGAGNGVLGLGWSLHFPSIRRRTDSRLPTYRDDDVFQLSGGEDLVPAVAWDGDSWEPGPAPPAPYAVRRYRPRIDRDFDRIERITEPVLGTWWRVTSRDNVTTFFGTDATTRITDPADGSRVFEWLPAFSFDDRGNCLVYQYAPEDLEGVDTTLAESNRHRSTARFSNLHLKRLLYGNRTPYAVASADAYRPPPPAGEFLFEAVLDFGEHDGARPTPEAVAGRRWPARHDAFSSYRSGFEIRTYRLLRRVLMFHRFDELDGGQPTLVRSLDLAYATTAGGDAVGEFTYLASATRRGYVRRPDGEYASRSLPPVELGYEPLRWDPTVRTVDRVSTNGLPAGVGPGHQWVDLLGEGIPGVLSEQAAGWHFKANLGDVAETGEVSLGPTTLVAPKPSYLGLGGALQLQELEADGRKHVVVGATEAEGFFELADGEWLPYAPFPSVLRVNLRDRHLRMLDLVGDGRGHVLASEDGAFVWYRSRGCEGYEAGGRTPRPSDEEAGPAVVFADSQQAIHLADMSGDGLIDIVRIRNGDVSYWPNLGYGRFGARVAMDGAPAFDHPDRYDPSRLKLADVSGTGATDLLYLDAEGCTVYLNVSGNGWSAGHHLPAPFPANPAVDVSALDLLGNGTTCLVWSSGLPAQAVAPLRYIDLMGGRKPHLLRTYVDNLGKELVFTYKSSTWFCRKDKAEGRPWATRLPFPVHCLRRVERGDRVRGSRLVTEYRYHHGYYDRTEREFRGFGMVEQVDAEHFEHWAKGPGASLVDSSLHHTPVLTKTWFHTGVVPVALREEHWDAEMRRQGFEVLAAEPAVHDGRLIPGPGSPADLLASLGPADRREAVRSCKGTPLRKEVFGLDAPVSGATEAQRRLQLLPYSVVTSSCAIVVLQPRHAGAHGVFTVHQSESVSRSYERLPDDPRIQHELNVRIDDVGNVLESASVAYGRTVADPALPPAVQALQGRTRVTFTRNEFTDDVSNPVDHRLRASSRTTTFEISGLAPGTAPLFSLGDFARPGFHVLADSTDVPHFNQGAPPAGTVFRRMLRRTESVYYDASVVAPLGLHQLDARAIPYETYELAFPPDLLADVFGARATDALMAEGRYVHRGDASWWVASGRNVLLDAGEGVAAARARFFAPVAHVDGHGSRTTIRHFGAYALMPSEIEDAAGNRARVTAFDLRSVTPVRIVDPNDNISETVLDELGMVKASAVLGKGADADSLEGLQSWTTPEEATRLAAFLSAPDSVALAAAGAALLRSATIRHVYDVGAYQASGGTSPPMSASISREEHAAFAAASPVQIGFEYSNGSGEVELHKVQAESGLAKRVTVLAGGLIAVEEVDTRASVPPHLRWLGNGRKVLNNKGLTVKEYGPFFSVTHRFESFKELVESGVTSISSYDPVDRLQRVDYPDGTISRVEIESWRTAEHDRNDTVMQSAWHQRRVGRLIDAELMAAGRDPQREEQAARQTEAHAGTPLTRHLDPLSRPVLEVHHNRDDAGNDRLLRTTNVRDVDGRTLSVTDARGNTTIAYRYDLRGGCAAYRSADGGTRWMLDNALDEPLRSWDERGHEFSFIYDDPLHRLTAKRVRGGDGPVPLDHVYERRVYGEGGGGAAAANLRTRVAALYDTAGRVRNLAYDLAGNLVSSSRRFCSDHRAMPDWSSPDPEAALEAAAFTSSARYDALSRVAERTAADGSVYRPGYNAANLLDRVRVVQPLGDELHVTDIDYDEKGQRRRIVFGNGVTVTYDYERETFRLTRLTTRRAGGEALQDLRFTYDPSGNATHVSDGCVPTVCFGNHMVTGLSTYRYDTLYRLVEATGREHAGQVDFGTTDNWADTVFRHRLDPNDALAWRTYTQVYEYDDTGNLGEVTHTAGTGSWTRGYTYAASSNRLLSTNVGATVFPYSHHPAHGYIDGMPHFSSMTWNFRDELRAIATQVVNAGTPETTWYVYDGKGNRVRKVTEGAAAAGAQSVKRFERYYLDGVEVAREYDGAGAPVKERRSFDVTDGRQRINTLEDESAPGVAPVSRLVRYQSTDLLGSTHLETDDTGRVISYEVFHPFGTTAYQATDKTVVAAAKRYRYTGMERDEESGLEYHAARYYAPWLGRWTAPDQHPERIDGNRYAYVKNNPVVFRDPNGLSEEPIHGALTYRLALAAGFSEGDAATIALSAAGMDHEKDYRPGDDGVEMLTHMFEGKPQRYHYPTMEEAAERVKGDMDTGVTDLVEFGRHLHSLEDVGFTDAPGPHTRGVKVLGPLLVLGSGALGVAGGLAAWGASEAFGESGAGYKALGVLAAIATAVAFAGALFALVFGAVAGGSNHPMRITEKGNLSLIGHLTDRAPEDPIATTKTMKKIYHVLRAARLRRAEMNGEVAPEPDEAIADAAIAETVSADTSDKVNALFLAAAPTPDGGMASSYAQVRMRARWQARDPDVSLTGEDYKPYDRRLVRTQ